MCAHSSNLHLHVLFFREFSDKQPVHFDDIQDFINFIRAHPKKGAEMSQFTVNALYDMWDEYMENDQKEEDSVGNFVERNAKQLGFRETSGK